MALDRELSHAIFHHDFLSLMIATDFKVRVIDLKDCGTPNGVFEQNTQCALRCVDQDRDASILMMVNAEEPKRLSYLSCCSGHSYPRTTTEDEIRFIKANGKNVIVFTDEKVYIIPFARGSVEDVRKKGIRVSSVTACTLTSQAAEKDNNFLAYPDNSFEGEVAILDVTTCRPKTSFKAHSSKINYLEFNSDGNLLATASVKGTVIRVFDVIEGTLLYEFRRGSTKSAVIRSLAFNKDSTFLACLSDRTTLHIFKLDERSVDEIKNAKKRGFLGSFSDPERAFVTISVGTQNSRVSWSKDGSTLLLLTADGVLRTFEVQLVPGHSWNQIGEYHLWDHEASTVKEFNRSTQHIDPIY